MTTTTVQRIDGRNIDQLRPYSFERNFIKTAEGSCLVTCGETRVIVTAKIEPNLPPHLREAGGQGWITAEYSMLPGSSHERIGRERNKANSRSLEIQRLIGRSLRAMVDMKAMPPITINIDADVIQADGGTRTASITGAYVAVYDCLRYLQKNGIRVRAPKGVQGADANGMIHLECFKNGLPIMNQIAAISVGMRNNVALLDLNYEEDSTAQADGNFILTSKGEIIEIQTTAEDGVITEAQFQEMFKLGVQGVKQLCELQNEALNNLG
jgi:ribonuclease PH